MSHVDDMNQAVSCVASYALSDYELYIRHVVGAIQGARTPANAGAMFDALPERHKPEVRARLHAAIGLKCEGEEDRSGWWAR